jgi:hypothetical protein
MISDYGSSQGHDSMVPIGTVSVVLCIVRLTMNSVAAGDGLTPSGFDPAGGTVPTCR